MSQTVGHLSPGEVFASAQRISPATPEELAAALAEADGAGRAVAPVGGGTQLDLGAPPTRVDVVLQTSGLNRVVEYEPADLTVTVEAGLPFADLQRLLAENGQMLALDPPALDGATIGGLIATNASGPLRFSAGTARDLVIGTRVANPEGTLTHAGGRVVKNVAGYDLNKLYIGSLGTLGVIVELSFKLAPIPPATGTVLGSFTTLQSVRAAIGGVVRSPLSALAIELLGPGAAHAVGLPAERVVAYRVGGYPQAVERQVRDLTALIASHGGTPLEAPETIWQDLAAMRVAAQRRDVLLKGAVPLAASAALVDLLSSQLEHLQPTIWAHAGNGVAFAACDAPPSPGVLTTLRGEVAALGANASLVIQRCPAKLAATVDVWGDVGSSLQLMRGLKAKLDPRNTLNPGRYVGGI